MPFTPNPQTLTRCGIAAVIAGAVAAGALGAAPHAHARTGTSTPPVAPAAARTIRFRVSNATLTPLTVHHSQVYLGRWRSGEKPRDVGDVGIDDYTVESTSGEARAYVIYQIGSSGEYARVYAYNPLVWSNEASCSVEDSAGKTVKNPKYTCRTSTGSGNDMDASFVVEPVTAATHVITARSGFDSPGVTKRDVLEAFCPAGLPAFVSCSVLNRSDVIDVTAARSAEQISSNILINCSTSPAIKQVMSATTIGETNTIGVTAEVQFKLGEIVTTKLATTYQYQWSHSITSSQATTVTVQPGEFGYIATSAWMQRVRANYTIAVGNQTFTVDDVTLDRPMNATAGAAYQPIEVARTHRIDTDGVCAGHRGLDFFEPKPVTPSPSGTYTIGLRSANQRTIAVPASAHSSGVALELGPADTARAEQWTFYDIPARPGLFQIRSANTQNLCIDLDGATDRTIMQFPCKAPTDPTIDNQLWRLQWDPELSAYTIASARGPVASIDGTPRTGAPVIGATTPPAPTSRWTFHTT